MSQIQLHDVVRAGLTGRSTCSTRYESNDGISYCNDKVCHEDDIKVVVSLRLWSSET